MISGTIVFGFMLIAIGILWLLEHFDVVDIKAAIILPFGLMAIGISLMIGARHGEHAGLVVLGVVTTLLVLLAAITPISSFADGVGDVEYAPASRLALEPSYEHGIGKMTVDLSAVPLSGTVETAVDLAIGEMIVLLPAQAEYQITADVAAGQLMLFGETQDGLGVEANVTSDGFDTATDRIVLDLEVFTGKIEVRR